MPLARTGLLDEARPTDQGRQYTVFEFQRRPRHRSYGRDWTLQDIITDAVQTAASPTRHVRVLIPAIQGFFEPQIVLTRRDAPHGWSATPCDLRALGRDVVTTHLPPHVQLRALPEYVSDGPLPFRLFSFRQLLQPGGMMEGTFTSWGKHLQGLGNGSVWSRRLPLEVRRLKEQE